jgi:hypothetical protein
MAAFHRIVIPSATYFFAVNTYQRLKVLTKTPFYAALKKALKQARL